MTTNMLTTAWDDTMKDPDIDVMEAEHKARRHQVPRTNINRFMFWYLDRAFFKAVRKNQTMTQARENAIDSWGVLKGLVAGILSAACFFGAATFFWTAARAGEWTNIVLNVGAFALGVVLASGLIRRLWRKVRHKES